MDISNQVKIAAIENALKHFIESKRFEDSEIFLSDLDLCKSIIRLYEDKNYKMFDLFSAVYKTLSVTVDKEEIRASKEYCKFVTYTCLGASDNENIVEIMALSFEKLVDLCTDHRRFQKIGNVLLKNIIIRNFVSKDVILNTLKKILLKIKILESDVHFENPKELGMIEEEHHGLMRMIYVILKYTDYSYSESSFTTTLIHFYLNTYKKFQNRTFIEWKDSGKVRYGIAEEDKLVVVLSTIKKFIHVFPSYKTFVVERLVRHWPKSFFHEKVVIEYFMSNSKMLSEDEITEKLEAILVKQFDKLFLYSQNKIFEFAYDTAMEFFDNLLKDNVQRVYYDFVGFKNCFGKQLNLFRENERKLLMKVDGYAAEIRKKALIRTKNLEVEYKKRKQQKLKTLSTDRKKSLKIPSRTNKTFEKKIYKKEDKKLANIVKVVKNNHFVKRTSSSEVEFSGKKKKYNEEPVVDLAEDFFELLASV